MFRKKINNKGFTLVEVLAVIAIISILAILGITAVSRLIDRSRKEQVEQQKKSILMAVQSYVGNNRNELPKSIGEVTRVSVQTLKDSNYLKEDIKTSKGESCMTNSYVRINKVNSSDYSYFVYLYCGEEEVPAEESVPKPKITLYFTDSSNTIDNNEVFNNVSKAKLVIKISGSETASDEIALAGYSFSISVRTGEDTTLHEVYSSGTINANKALDVEVNKRLRDYVDITTASYFVVKVNANNVLGGTNEATSVGSNGSSEETTYLDTVSPVCVSIENEESGNSWVNKASNSARTITAVCTDGNGSGCIRDRFTMTWPNEKQPDAEYAYIQIKDNAGNTNIVDQYVNNSDPCALAYIEDTCRVHVNVDTHTPEINIEAYKANAAGTDKESGGSSIFSTGVVKVADNHNSVVTIDSSKYGELVNGWMNKTSYPNGIIFKITAKDNLHLDSWTWETNATYVSSTSSSNYRSVSVINPDGKSGTFAVVDPSTSNCGTLQESFYFILKGEGRRYGVLTVKDAAGNTAKYQIAVNIDRTAPPVPSITMKKWSSNSSFGSGTAYTDSSWSKFYVRTSIDSTWKKDAESGNTTLSGWDKFDYIATNASNVESSGTAEFFDFKDTFQGKNKVKFRSCDKAGNCSGYCGNSNVWVDTIAPTCQVTATDQGGSNYTGAWLGIGKNATVKAHCVETASNVNSGCNTADFSHLYNSNINTTTAGAKGNSAPGQVVDIAGNTTTCGYKTVKIDHTNPSCSLKVTTSGVTFNTKTDNNSPVTFGLIKSAAATYNSTNSLALSAGTFYGYVKDVAGNTSSCSVNLYSTVAYQWTQTTYSCVRGTPSRYDKTTRSCERVINNYYKTTKTCGVDQHITTYTPSGTTPYQDDYICMIGCRAAAGTRSWRHYFHGPGLACECWFYAFSSSNTLNAYCSTSPSFTCNASNSGRSYVSYCNPNYYYVGSNSTTSATSCSVQSVPSCNASSYGWTVVTGCKVTAYNYVWNSSSLYNTTSCSATNSFTCNSSNNGSSYKTCTPTAWKCTNSPSGQTKITNSYCYKF